MSNVIITAENLSKSYLVAHQSGARDSYNSLRDVIGHEARNFVRNVTSLMRGARTTAGDDLEEFWALKDISFEVRQGEIVGIVGRNGAGKSTLLKILARITEPTKGNVQLRGRVASLLEVGTGFHPELTGRENIFLNGAILGMTQREIRRKFDEIIAFAEIERFLDTPVKRYSSGMYVRLAFAVAAHLEPEILIVDEVLAVGDSDFQKKCLGKMDSISRQEGRTILFVSHNMEAILQFCTRSLLFQSGQLIETGSPKEIVAHYLETKRTQATIVDLRSRPRDFEGLGRARIVEARTVNKQQSWSFSFGEQIVFQIIVESDLTIPDVELGLGLFSNRGFEVASWTNLCAEKRLTLRPGLNSFQIEYRDLLLLPGQYFFGIGVKYERRFEDYLPESVSFEVLQNERSAGINAQTFGGLVVPNVEISSI